MSGDTVLGWVAIGAAASLAGMIWPFRRGVLGIIVNLVAGTAGAVLVALASYIVFPAGSHGETPARLWFAALGALAALGVVHAAWLRAAPRAPARVRSGP
jgi:uncharacterized membrane protein YeaQ/YmgE (transglycosylase-associated protein family)